MKSQDPLQWTRREFCHRVGIVASTAAPLCVGARLTLLEEGTTQTAEHRITDHGARKRRDEINTEAIQAAIDACHAAGGGRVRIPPGRFRTGALRLKTNVHLHLDEGAILQGSNDWRDYRGVIERPQTEGRQWGDGEWSNAMITAQDATNVRIEGPGTIDGSDCTNPNGEEGFRGPHAVVLRNCIGIQISDVTIRRAGNYAILCFDSKNAQLSHVRVRGGHDAVHLQRCEHFRIHHCDFRTGDDCFAGCDNVDLDIRHCRINSSCNGFRLGCVDLVVKDCRIWGPGEYAHKSSGRTNLLSAFVHFAPQDRNPQRPSDNWQIEDLAIDQAEALYLYDFQRGGWQQGQPAKRLHFKDIKASNLAGPTRIVGDRKRRFRLTLENVSLALREGSHDQPVLDINRFDSLTLRDVRLANSGGQPVLTASQGRKVRIDNLTAIPDNNRPYMLEAVDTVKGV